MKRHLAAMGWALAVVVAVCALALASPAGARRAGARPIAAPSGAGISAAVHFTSPTATRTLSPSPTVTASVTVTATATATVTATAGPTATFPASPSAPPTVTATPSPPPSPVATATPSGPAPVYLPLAAQRAPVFGTSRRTWGLQLPLDDWPDRQALNVRYELPRARNAGLTAVRTNLRWDVIEPHNTTPDQYDWREADRRLADYASRGFEVLVTVVAYPGWAMRYGCGYEVLPGMEAEWRQFVRAAAERYGRPPYRVVGWEIGNEPDGKTVVNPEDWERPPGWGPGAPTVPLGGCWGDRAPEYMRFLRAAYEEIKAVEPDVLVTHGGLAYADINNMFHTDFLDKLLAAGGGAYFDFLNYHWFPNVPRQPPGPDKHRSLMAVMARHGVSKPVWLTETYRLTFADDPFGSQVWQIRFLTRELVEMLAFPEIERVYWYGWVDFPPGYREPGLPERGLVRDDRSAKVALAILPHLVTVSDGRPEDVSTSQVVATRFRSGGGRHDYVIAWSRDGSPVPFSLPATTEQPRAWVRVFPEDALLAGSCCPEYRVGPRNGAYRFVVGGDSLFITIPSP